MREFFRHPQARRTQISSGLVSFSWVRAPPEEIFFSEILYQMEFFLHSNILESYLISLRGQNNLKTQKVQEISKIAIYLCSIHFNYLKICSH